MAGSIEDIFLSCSEPKRNVVEPSLVSVGTAKMIHCRRRCWWWCVHDVRLKITMHRCGVWTCMSAANACWIVLCKCMLDIKCSVLRGWSCAITKSFEFWLRTDEKMGLTLSGLVLDPLYDMTRPLNVCWTSNAQYCGDGAVQSPKVSHFGSELMKRWG